VGWVCKGVGAGVGEGVGGWGCGCGGGGGGWQANTILAHTHSLKKKVS